MSDASPIGGNTVRLTRENIDLKRRLDESEELIDALKLKLSQQAKHVFTHEVRNSKLSLADVAGTGKSVVVAVGGGEVSGGVSAGEYDALEAELEESRQREEALKARVALLEQERRHEAPSSATPHRGTSPALINSGSAHAAASPELASARKRIETLEQSERKLKAAVDDLNAALEATITASPPPPPASTSASGERRVGDAEPAGQDAEDLENRLLSEQAAQALLAEELEETKLYMEEERREFERKLSEATSEKNIAIRVKNEALKEAASARTEAARLRGEIASSSPGGKQQQQQLQQQSSADALILRDQVTFLESRLAAMQHDLDASQKDAARAHKAGKRAFLERQTALKDLEAWKVKQVETVKQKVTATAKSQAAAAAAMSMSSSSHNVLLNSSSNLALTSQHATTQQFEDHHVESCVESAAQKLGAIQERLLLALAQRAGSNSEKEFHHHHHHYRDPQQTSGEGEGLASTSKSTSSTGSGGENVSGGVGRSRGMSVASVGAGGGDGGSSWLVEEIFMGGDDWAQLVCEEFYAYERQIQNLKADVLSLQMIAQMSDADTTAHWKRKVEAMDEEMAVLRVAAHEYREAAAAAQARHQQTVAGFQAAQQLNYEQQSPQNRGDVLVGRVVPSAAAYGSPAASSAASPSPPYYHQPSYSSPNVAASPQRK